MGGRGLVYGGGDALNHKQKVNICFPDQPMDSIFASASSNSFVGSRAMVSFGAVKANGSGNSFYRSFDQEESGDEYLDEYFTHPEKKRRLNADQVHFLEKSFEAEHKLEPERKNQLAMELGLQPRQIAIWFQNRRARLRTKQVETDYEMLYAKYNSLKSDYDNLLEENEKLKAEVCSLKDNVFAIDEEKENSQKCAGKPLPCSQVEKPVSCLVCKDEESKLFAIACRNEDQSSVRSDSTDFGGHPFTKGILTLLDESVRSDFSQSGENNSSDELRHLAHVCPKIEDAHCHTPNSSWNFGLPIEDHGFGFWSY